MHLLLIWFVTYVVPAGLSWLTTFFLTRKAGIEKYNLLIIHAALLISIGLSQYAIYSLGLSFPWRLTPISLVALAVALVFTRIMIGSVGPWYLGSALIQEFAMISIAYVLLSYFPVHIVVLLVAPVFVLAHFLSFTRWKIRLLLLSLWGTITIPLFILTYNVYVIAALHAIVGSFFISRSVMLFSKDKDLVAGWLK